jgi:hypothetical protein
VENLDDVIEKQRQEIEELKRSEIHVYEGFGKEVVLSFGGLMKYPDGDEGINATQRKIDEGHYKSIEDFDSYHTADIEFIDYYSGNKIEVYREKTKAHLIELGHTWRDRISKEFPEADITIVVHKRDDEWFLDTFNYPAAIEDAIFI